MKYNQEYVYCLLLRKQLGDLGEDEEKYLKALMQDHDEIETSLREMQESAEISNTDLLHDLRTECDWLRVTEMLERKSFKQRIASIIDLTASRFYPRWITKVIDRKLKIIRQTDPDKIFVSKIQQFFHIPVLLARLFCEMAVQVGLFRRKVVIVCPKCRRIVAVYSDKSEIPNHIACNGCEGTTELSVFHSDQSYRIIFYQLIRNEVITA
jgi:hypothetical protein